MPDDTRGWAKLLQTAIEALSGWRRQAVLTGAVAVVGLFAACFMLEWRLTGEVKATALTPALGLVLDAKLLAMAGVATILILAWLVARLYALCRNRSLVMW